MGRWALQIVMSAAAKNSPAGKVAHISATRARKAASSWKVHVACCLVSRRNGHLLLNGHPESVGNGTKVAEWLANHWFSCGFGVRCENRS